MKPMRADEQGKAGVATIGAVWVLQPQLAACDPGLRKGEHHYGIAMG
jgi:hypothetical protein